ncbi:MAG: amidohydrolase family protein [Clostridiales bacterium]|jgi:5-methylthioadenosine/S-adenosylhomocysteine deaminase|nr:amidohydrolase family protein [Clostridiales bacterium]
MLFKDITIINEDFTTTRNVCVGIREGKIAHIGGFTEGFGEEFDGRGYLLAPAFCSAHSHTAMTLLRGMGSDLPLDRWLNEAIFPEEAKLTPKAIYNGTLAGCAEMLKYGTVSCNDMYFMGKAMADAYIDAKIKANISVAVLCFDDSAFIDMPKYNECLMLEEYLKDNDKVRLDYAVHAEYTNTPKSAATVAEFAASRNAGLHIHVSETKSEHEDCISRHGMTPVKFFFRAGGFDTRTIAAHCVWCTDEDYSLMGEKGVFMASCPTSNLKLGSGIPDYKRALERNVQVCIGTDGVASNNNLNMVKEAKLMALLTKGYNLDPSLCKSRDALIAATRTAWLSQGRQNSGLIKVGYDADLAVYDINTVNTKKARDGVDTLIYACDGEAYMTLCNGEVLYKNGEYYTIDIEKLEFEIT